MERHILRERTSSCPISSSWSKAVQTLVPPPTASLMIGCVSLARLSILPVSIWPCGSHITWSPSGYTPARPAYPDALPSPCLLITTWQLVKAHGVTNPCQQSLYIFLYARGVMVIVIGNGRGNTSSNHGRDWLHFSWH